MPRKKLPGNAPCPRGSGKKYRNCCYNKGFEYLVDEDGTIFKAIPMSDELAKVIEEQKREFIKQHKREPGPDDNIFFDMPPAEHVEHFMVQAMRQAGLHPAVIYAFEKTGRLVTEQNQHMLSEKDLVEWEAAIHDYETRQGNEEMPEDEEEEWF